MVTKRAFRQAWQLVPVRSHCNRSWVRDAMPTAGAYPNRVIKASGVVID